MFGKKLRIVPDASEAFRLTSICLIAIVTAAGAMSVAGSPMKVAMIAATVATFAAAMVFLVNRAITHLVRRSSSLSQAAIEAEKHYVQVLLRIIDYVEARDRLWSGHSENVGRLAERIARRMGLPDRLCTLMNLAGRLHDIGILAVPDRMRRNSAPFNVDDFRSIQPHSTVSYEVLKPMVSLGEILPAIKHHHERMNGTGYPDGLAGEKIPPGARILAVADAFDAMTHDRPHRPAITPLQAVAELRRCSPAGYDPVCVEALAKAIHLPALEMMQAGETLAAS